MKILRTDSRIPQAVRNALVSGTVFSIAVIGISSSYAALVSGLSTADKSVSGGTLSSTSWNRLVDSVLELDTRTTGIASASTVNYLRSKNGTTTQGAGINLYNEDETTYKNNLHLLPGPNGKVYMPGDVGIGTMSPTATLHVNGTIKSPKWNVIQPMNMVAGAMPVTSQSFSTNGGTLRIFVAGSGHRSTAGQIGMTVKLDGTIIGYSKSYTNEVSSHKAFVPNEIVVSGIAAGSHTVTLESWNGTSSDSNDFYSVTVSEMPW